MAWKAVGASAKELYRALYEGEFPSEVKVPEDYEDLKALYYSQVAAKNLIQESLEDRCKTAEQRIEELQHEKQQQEKAYHELLEHCRSLELSYATINEKLGSLEICYRKAVGKLSSPSHADIVTQAEPTQPSPRRSAPVCVSSGEPDLANPEEALPSCRSEGHPARIVQSAVSGQGEDVRQRMTARFSEQITMGDGRNGMAGRSGMDEHAASDAIFRSSESDPAASHLAVSHVAKCYPETKIGAGKTEEQLIGAVKSLASRFSIHIGSDEQSSILRIIELVEASIVDRETRFKELQMELHETRSGLSGTRQECDDLKRDIVLLKYAVEGELSELARSQLARSEPPAPRDQQEDNVLEESEAEGIGAGRTPPNLRSQELPVQDALPEKMVLVEERLIAEATAERLNEGVVSLKAENGFLKAEIEDLKSEIQDRTAEIEDLKSEIGCLNSEIGCLKSEIQDRTAEIEDLKSEIGLLKAENQDRTERNREVSEEVTRLKQQLINESTIKQRLETIMDTYKTCYRPSH